MTIRKGSSKKGSIPQIAEDAANRTSVKRKKVDAPDSAKRPVRPRLDTLPVEIIDMIAKEALSMSQGGPPVHAIHGFAHGNRRLADQANSLTSMREPFVHHRILTKKVDFLWGVLAPENILSFGISFRQLYPAMNYASARYRKILIDDVKKDIFICQKLSASEAVKALAPAANALNFTRKERKEILSTNFNDFSVNIGVRYWIRMNYDLLTGNQKKRLFQSYVEGKISVDLFSTPLHIFTEIHKKYPQIYKEFLGRYLSEAEIRDWESFKRLENLDRTVLNYVQENLSDSDVDVLIESGNLYLAAKVVIDGYGSESKKTVTSGQLDRLLDRLCDWRNYSYDPILMLAEDLSKVHSAAQEKMLSWVESNWDRFAQWHGSTSVFRRFVSQQQNLSEPVRERVFRLLEGALADPTFYGFLQSAHIVASSRHHVDALERRLLGRSHHEVVEFIGHVAFHRALISDDKAICLLKKLAEKPIEDDIWENGLLYVLMLSHSLSAEMLPLLIKTVVQTETLRLHELAEVPNFSNRLAPEALDLVLDDVLSSPWPVIGKTILLGKLAPTPGVTISKKVLDAVVEFLNDNAHLTGDYFERQEVNKAYVRWYLVTNLSENQQKQLEAALLIQKDRKIYVREFPQFNRLPLSM